MWPMMTAMNATAMSACDAVLFVSNAGTKDLPKRMRRLFRGHF